MSEPVAVRVAALVAERLEDHVDAVVALARIGSGSEDPDGVARVADAVADLVAPHADLVETRSVGTAPTLDAEGRVVQRELGPALVALRRPDAPVRVLVFGHLDTVFGPDHPFRRVERAGEVLTGPGVADCKGGIVTAIAALAALERLPGGADIGWELVCVPDEEIGSPGSKPLLLEAAARCRVGVGIEPALPSGAVARARKGSTTLHLVVTGRAAHVGRAHADGVSAVAAAARLVTALESLNGRRPGLTVNVGRLTGGGPLNVVPDRALVGVNVRAADPDDEAFFHARLDEILPLAAPATVTLVEGGHRPPKLLDDDLRHLLDHLGAAAAELGVDVDTVDTGGCCDGNDLAAAGLPNIDSLGVRGGGIHSEAEFACIDSIPERAGLIAGLLTRVAADVTAGHGRPTREAR